MSICSSSIKRMILGLFFTASIISRKRSSSSPRYLAPATTYPSSREKMTLSCRNSGTSFLTIRCASPSATAVLPTPASPISTGLFFVRRHKIRIRCSNSFSRPKTGSSLSCSASSFRLRPNPCSSFSALRCLSSSCSFLACALNLFPSGKERRVMKSSCIMLCTRFTVMPKRARTRDAMPVSSAKRPSRIWPELTR